MNHCSQPHKKEDNFFSPLEHYFEEISDAEDAGFASILTKPDKFVEPKTENEIARICEDNTPK